VTHKSHFNLHGTHRYKILSIAQVFHVREKYTTSAHSSRVSDVLLMPVDLANSLRRPAKIVTLKKNKKIIPFVFSSERKFCYNKLSK